MPRLSFLGRCRRSLRMRRAADRTRRAAVRRGRLIVMVPPVATADLFRRVRSRIHPPAGRTEMRR
jgi:hypothetical protein